ncbi:LysR family transcriptional regulator [Paraneptunicella aestuarii]|uniref:LysR family transcriptional regulator n=1 Tax=Paraneptunicella aestuarii TaxID=2831148 RepID=UPI001E4373A2|nr:LysR family transcriptional regulator [Paraneptunicella aestuarii]UAA39827.1 LysR family transcriptional regulator [Paraneptunicella aestuarii]
MLNKSTTHNQLMLFHCIVQEGSIRGAARKLSLAAPSVSQSLKLLEQNLGLSLFTRTTRHLELTQAGQQLYDKTLPAIKTLESALDEVTSLGNAPSGKVKITLPRFVYQLFFRHIFAEFCQLYPQIELEISISDATVNIIKDGIDVGIRFGDRIEPTMVAKRLTPNMSDALFASAGYIEQHGMPNSIEALQHHKLIHYRFIASNMLAQLNLQEQGQPVAVNMPTALIVNDTDLMVEAAKQGVGIGRLVQPVVASAFEQGTLLPVLPEHWIEQPGLFLYFAQHSQKAKRVRVLIDFIEQRKVLHW